MPRRWGSLIGRLLLRPAFLAGYYRHHLVARTTGQEASLLVSAKKPQSRITQARSRQIIASISSFPDSHDAAWRSATYTSKLLHRGIFLESAAAYESICCCAMTSDLTMANCDTSLPPRMSSRRHPLALVLRLPTGRSLINALNNLYVGRW